MMLSAHGGARAQIWGAAGRRQAGSTVSVAGSAAAAQHIQQPELCGAPWGPGVNHPDLGQACVVLVRVLLFQSVIWVPLEPNHVLGLRMNQGVGRTKHASLELLLIGCLLGSPGIEVSSAGGFLLGACLRVVVLR